MKESFNPGEVVSILKRLLPLNRDFIALHEPSFEGNEWAYVKECLDSTWVSSAGRYVERFETQLVDYTGVKYAVAMVNGTAALHLALQILGIRAGDEVIIPTLTFIATANAVSYLGATPHLADSETQTLGLNPLKLADYLQEISELQAAGCINIKTGRPIKAVVPMHTFGHPVDMDPLVEVCERYGLLLIEDSAEALGSYYKNKHTGSWGKLSILSFNGNKVVTTGGGGAILTNDESLARLARHLSTQAKLPHQWSFMHDQTGYNYRMPNINAALGCAQMEQLGGFIRCKRKLARRYQEAFAGVEGVQVFKEPLCACSNYWLNALLLNEEYACQRDPLLELTHREGILTRPAWTPMHKLPMYQNCPRMDLSGAESLEHRIINLPSSVYLAGSFGSSSGHP